MTLKDFSEHEKYFLVLPKIWERDHKEPFPYSDKRVLLCGEKLFDFETFHHSVKTKNGWDNYTIGKSDNLKYRVWYLHRWHIPVAVLTKAVPDEEWQRQIDAYNPEEPKKSVKVKAKV